MESFEDSSKAKNPMRLECESDKSKNCKETPREKGEKHDDENVFTSMSNQNDTGCTSQNGPRTRNSYYSSSGDSGQSGRTGESSAECSRNSATHPHTCNRLPHTSSELTTTLSSNRAESSIRDNGLDATVELQTCQRHKVCQDKAGNTYNLPSTSGASRSFDLPENNDFKENRKRPSSLKLNRTNYEEDSSSDTGNDDYSLGSEDGCIYTYRGGEHLADLPSSFFSLDMGLPVDRHLPIPPNYQVPQQAAANAGANRSRASSPDMDFLEMDFDPGPSCEVDTGDESSPDADLDAASNMPEESEPVIRGTSPEYVAGARANPAPVVAVPSISEELYYDVPSTSRGVTAVPSHGDTEPRSSHSSHVPHVYYGPYITHTNARGEQLLVRRTMSHWPHAAPVSLHVSSGDLVSPREMLNYDEEQLIERPFTHQINQGERPTFDSANLSSALYHLIMAKKLIEDENPETPNLAGDTTTTAPVTSTTTVTTTVATTSSTAAASCVEPPRCMVWSEREACERQVTQIGTSACGATAIVNVFVALGVPVNIEKISSAVGTRQRANTAPVPRYLLSRAVAGCTAADLVNGIQKASDGLVTARFFPTYPERAFSLSHWLADWISLGAVPILTLNLQVGCEGEIPDAWHHQMVFGVSSRGVYLCNPVECVRETALWPRLTSPSVLLVRTRDVLARFNTNTDLTPLMFVPDRRFLTFNVFGQVVNAIREWRSTGWNESGTRTRHIRLPASYQAGVTVAALTGSEAHRRLMHAPQLPILAPHRGE
ncbi:hypothetical protein NE865_13503 [Phthorimaea operculella]|nr:hypothetical protein NE865_13503 [Phthorimaea operculella]